MWSDNDIDNAFRGLNPPEPEPAPFPLDAWLRLEDQLDKAVLERAVRRRLWKFFAAEVAVVALVALGWLAWPTAVTPTTGTAPKSLGPAPGQALSATAPARRAAGEVKHPATSSTPGGSRAAEAFPVPPALAPAPETADLPSSAPPALKAVAGAPTKPLATAFPHLALASTAAPDPSRHYPADGRISPHALAVPLNTHPNRNNARPHSGTWQEPPAARRAAVSLVSFAGSSTARHPAAGNIAAPAEAPTPAVVAATAGLRHRREGQSPLPALLATSAPDAAAPAGVLPESGPLTAEAPPAASSSSALNPTGVSLLLPAAAGLPAPLATTALDPAPLPVPMRQPRFYVGLVAAPDVSTVRFASVASPMPNVGVTLEYRLSNRLRVSTGLLRSTKQYVARREDYDWGAYSKLVYSHNFTDVDGTCTVLDVPLNLRYALLLRPSYQLFASAGLSSYFMQREHYYYDWTDANGFHAWNGAAVNQNRHLLSILNLSVGYERRLGAHWSVQAEPYAKLPLAGVGLGKVRLASAGAFFGVKYGF